MKRSTPFPTPENPAPSEFRLSAAVFGGLILLASCSGPAVRPIPDADRQTDFTEIQSSTVPGYGSTEGEVAEAYEDFLKEHPDVDPSLRSVALKRLGDLSLTLAHKKFLKDMEAYDLNPVGPPPLVDYDKAIRSYKTVLEEFPDFKETDAVLYSLSRAYSEMGERDEAFKTLRELSSRNPEGPYRQEVAFRLGEIYFDQGEFKNAASAYDKAIKPDDPLLEEKARYKLAWSYFNTKQYPLAVETFFPLLEKPEASLYWETLTYMAISLREMGGPPAVARFFRDKGTRPFEEDLYRMAGNQYVGEGKQSLAIETYRTFVREHPMHPMAPIFSSYVIDAYKIQKQPEAVREARIEWADHYNSSTPWFAANGEAARSRTRPILKESLHLLAMDSHSKALQGGSTAEYRSAVARYRQFLSEFPDESETPEFRFFLAEALYELKEYKEAAGLYETVSHETPYPERKHQAAYAAVVSYEKSESDPSHPEFIRTAGFFADEFPDDTQSPLVLIKAGEYLYDQGRYPEARERFDEVRTRYPDHEKSAVVQRLIGHAYMKEGAFEAAGGAYSKVLPLLKPEEDKDRAEITDLIGAAIYKLGETYKEKNQPSAAALVLARISDEAPKSRLAENSLFEAGELMESAGKPLEAVAMYQRFIQKYPESELTGKAWVKIGLVYEARKDAPATANAYIRASDTIGDPELAARLLWSAASKYQESGQKEKGYEAYRAFVDRFPDHSDAAEALYTMAAILKSQGKQKEAMVLYSRIGREAQGTYFAAQSQFEIAESSFRRFEAVRLAAPLDKNFKKKTELMNKTIDLYVQAMDAGFADIVTAGTFRVGEAFEHFKDALLTSEAPKELTADQIEEYSFQLEEKAFPFEEKAVEAYESNIRRVRSTAEAYDDWIKKSYDRLATLRPALYRRPEREERVISDLDWEALNLRESENRVRGIARVK